MANQATLNPNLGQRATRAVGRIKTLRLAIEKAKARNQDERVASLQRELDGLMTAAVALKSELESVL